MVLPRALSFARSLTLAFQSRQVPRPPCRSRRFQALLSSPACRSCTWSRIVSSMRPEESTCSRASTRAPWALPAAIASRIARCWASFCSYRWSMSRPGGPDDVREEAPPRALREPLDERRVGGSVDHVVEGVVGRHPARHERAVLGALARTAPQLERQLREALLRLVERRQPLGGDPRRGQLGGEALELGPDEERLAQFLARERPHAHAAVRHERDEPERGEPPQRLADRRARDPVLLRELLLAQDRARRDLAGDDRLLERERDVVGLRADRCHAGQCRTISRQAARPRRCSRRSAPGRTAASARRASPRSRGRALPRRSPRPGRRGAPVVDELGGQALLGERGDQPGAVGFPGQLNGRHRVSSQWVAANCASSVEPDSASVEPRPPETASTTWSK